MHNGAPIRIDRGRVFGSQTGDWTCNKVFDVCTQQDCACMAANLICDHTATMDGPTFDPHATRFVPT